MDFIKGIIIHFSDFLVPYLSQVSMTFVATGLVLFGGDLNRFVRRSIQRYPFFIRLPIFIGVCVFGYGTLTLWLEPLLTSFFSSLSSIYLSPVILILFIAVGFLAERKHQI